jgi:hypothetical protein
MSLVKKAIDSQYILIIDNQKVCMYYQRITSLFGGFLSSKKSSVKGLGRLTSISSTFKLLKIVCIESWFYTSSKNGQFAFPSQGVMEIVCTSTRHSMNKMWGQFGKKSVTVILYI